jgi:hypothetical protein
MPKLPGVNHQDAMRTFQKAGYWILRQGKHIIMTNWRSEDRDTSA